MTQAEIDELKAVQEKLEIEGINQFNDKSNPPEVIAEGAGKYSAARKMLHSIGEFQMQLNMKSIKKK